MASRRYSHLGLGAGLLLAAALAWSAEYVEVPAGTLSGVLASDADRTPAAVQGFSMRVDPVTQAEYRRFVADHPEWRRDRVPQTFAGRGYLQAWPTPTDPPTATGQQPVVSVSWFAAEAYCESEGARLPTWQEWEYVAAADETRRDARKDPAWLARILGWYARPATAPVLATSNAPNVYGVRNMHGLIWEWVDDFNALLVSADSRSGDDPDKLKFCGAGAISLQDRENYAVLMRVA
ncbi:MAG TPA: formylglycine-generating enzyme family protein, partial [Rhizobacter sp.]|nr:formylglycine-generating enzyme family protein [Rhizobacter sp.]